MLLEMTPNCVAIQKPLHSNCYDLATGKTQHEYSLEFLCHVSRQGACRWDRWRCKMVSVDCSASSIVEVARGMPQVSVLEMTTSDIEKRNEALKLKDVPATKGIARFHYLTTEDVCCVPFVLTNDALETSEEIHLPADDPPTDTTEEEQSRLLVGC